MLISHTHSTCKMARFVETDLSTRVFRVTSGINECITTTANEPSVGLYRIQENVIGMVPRLVEDKQSMDSLCQRVQGCSYDLDNDREVVKEMKNIKQFRDIQNALSKAIEVKRQLNKIELEKQMLASDDTNNAASPTSIRAKHGPITPGLIAHGSYSINDAPSYQNSNPGDFSGIHIKPKTFK